MNRLSIVPRYVRNVVHRYHILSRIILIEQICCESLISKEKLAVLKRHFIHIYYLINEHR